MTYGSEMADRPTPAKAKRASKVGRRAAPQQHEREYTEGVLMPLLRRQGFNMVAYRHGANELGKDVVLREQDRFLLQRYWAVQVKHGALKLGVSFDEVLPQLNTAYETLFRDEATGTESKMSGVYLVVTGRVTAQARERLLARTGGWLHVVDGDQLALLEARGASDDHERQVKDRALKLVRCATAAVQRQRTPAVLRGCSLRLADDLDVEAAYSLQDDPRVNTIDIDELKQTATIWISTIRLPGDSSTSGHGFGRGIF